MKSPRLAQPCSAPQDGAMAEGERPAGVFGRGFIRNIWYFAGMAGDFRVNRLVRRELLGEPVMLGRAPSGQKMALRDICPHRAAPLSAGRFRREADGRESVECPYHGWRWGADGRCLAVP